MARESLHEKEQLENLEKAADEVAAQNPEHIEQAAAKAPEKRAARIAWALPYVIAAAVAIGLLVLLNWDPESFSIPTAFTETALRAVRGVLAVIVVLAIGRAIEVYWIDRLESPVARFNLKRIVRFILGLILVFIVISILFVEWYAAVVSLGLISLILGFALQTPISSFIGWIYILVRKPYRVGDRIEIGEARGDVIDVSYLDTTLWENGGRHLTTDHPSGRMIKFPNTKVFDTPVFNYSWPLFPYVWNEITVNIAYESDIEWVAATMQKVAEDELGEQMMEKVAVYRKLLARTPVDHLEVQERPTVQFRVSNNTWLEAIVRYVVEPRTAGRVKTRLTRNIITALNQQPDRVLFPKSNMR